MARSARDEGIRPRGRNGVGLGLYMVAQIVAAPGGTIEVSSARRTTRFTVTLPLGSPEASGPLDEGCG